MRLPLALTMVVAIAGSLSCSNKVILPVVPPAENIRLELVATGGGSPGAPVTLSGLVRNEGSAAVVPFVPCPMIYIRVYDALGNELHQADPTQPVPCPLGLVAPLAPGQTISFSLTFDGHYFTDTGDPMNAPPDTYRALATFRYKPPDPVPPSVLHGVTREMSFAWQ